MCHLKDIITVSYEHNLADIIFTEYQAKYTCKSALFSLRMVTKGLTKWHNDEKNFQVIFQKSVMAI